MGWKCQGRLSHVCQKKHIHTVPGGCVIILVSTTSRRVMCQRSYKDSCENHQKIYIDGMEMSRAIEPCIQKKPYAHCNRGLCAHFGITYSLFFPFAHSWLKYNCLLLTITFQDGFNRFASENNAFSDARNVDLSCISRIDENNISYNRARARRRAF